MRFATPLLLAPLALVALSGCSSDAPDAAQEATADDARREVAATDRSPASDMPPPKTASSGDSLIRLSGAAGLAVGEPVPSTSGFTSSGSAPGSDCRLYTSPAAPGVTALVESGTVKRITRSEGANQALDEEISVGSTAAQAKAAFPGFVETPHKYAPSPAAYLTQPGEDPRLRFEIGEDGRVAAIHVGVMPQLAYVEGCS
ncbi:hypothetical protein [Qipengyuania sp.]|uniref:hypothetical protein n=1 Tax=Qipengyuania sp. TaxID=2004515 RepID=UPI0035C828B3